MILLNTALLNSEQSDVDVGFSTQSAWTGQFVVDNTKKNKEFRFVVP